MVLISSYTEGEKASLLEVKVYLLEPLNHTSSFFLFLEMKSSSALTTTRLNPDAGSENLP
jgi:hypothetical protein